jgi:hypothetical protein
VLVDRHDEYARQAGHADLPDRDVRQTVVGVEDLGDHVVLAEHPPEAHMILSTLPDIPGRQFEIRGVVVVDGDVTVGGKSKPLVGASMQAIAKQASRLSANAVIDIKITRMSTSSWALTGTAVLVRD